MYLFSSTYMYLHISHPPPHIDFHILNALRWFYVSCIKVTGYKMGRSLHSKRNNSQCSFTPDCGYKRWSTNREALHAYTQPEGIGYLVRGVFYGWLNFANFWTKIWLSKQLKVMNDTLDRQFSTYSRARWSILLRTTFGFWEISRKLYTPHDFSPL